MKSSKSRVAIDLLHLTSAVAIVLMVMATKYQPVSAAHAAHITNAAASAAADTVCTLLNNGYIDIYDGTQPATADTAISGPTLLVTLRWNTTAFGAASSGVATANAITSGTAVATSTATWFRAYKSDHTTTVLDGTVCTSGCDINLGTASIASGGSVGVTAFTYTQSKS